VCNTEEDTDNDKVPITLGITSMFIEEYVTLMILICLPENLNFTQSRDVCVWFCLLTEL
jgi:hypothetical protein